MPTHRTAQHNAKKPWIAAFAAAFSLFALPAQAHADEDLSSAPIANVPRIFVGGWGGYALAGASHPEISTTRMRGTILGLQAGYMLSPRWTVALEFTDFMTSLSRRSGGEQFAAETTWLRPQAGCTNCEAPPVGGRVVATGLHLSTFSPRIEFAPLGPDGLYFGASVGMAALNALEQIHSGRIGGAGTLRAGFRARPAKNLTLSVEGGAAAQAYSDASAAMYFGALMARLYL